jgi:hypothetical protein
VNPRGYTIHIHTSSSMCFLKNSKTGQFLKNLVIYVRFLFCDILYLNEVRWTKAESFPDFPSFLLHSNFTVIKETIEQSFLKTRKPLKDFFTWIFCTMKKFCSLNFYVFCIKYGFIISDHLSLEWVSYFKF